MSKGRVNDSMCQTSFFTPLFVDLFAGGGGASTGIELATGRIVDVAINHNPAAVRLHQTNHPFTRHYCEDVWEVDPREVCQGRPVGVLWASPDCRHFSKAKGSALVDRKIRGLAWVVLRWAALARPQIIFLENVEEFQTWGPVRKGKPVKSKAGQTFQQWLKQLRALGYEVEYRELVAADYGAPTTRKRFVLIARCDGEPIVWPEPTHSETGAGGLQKWRGAEEILDFGAPMYSIFDTRQEIKEKYGVNAVRPLAENTLRRIIRGVDKFTIKSGRPFLIDCNHSGKGHVRGCGQPVGTILAKNTTGIANPILVPATFSNTNGSIGGPGDKPIPTGRSSGGVALSAASLIAYHTEQTEEARVAGLAGPISTIDGSNRYGLASAQLVEYYGTGRPLDLTEPMHTVTGRDREALTSAILQPYHAGGYLGKGNTPDAPVNTITSSGGQRLVASSLVKFKGKDLGQSAEKPLQTVTASSGEFADCRVELVRYDPGQEMHHWPEVRALLNQFCGYRLAEDEVLLLWIDGVPRFIGDILLRMLGARELYDAMGFPPDYIIDRDYTGQAYSKTEQVARCGNSVPPPLAEAVVRANVPEEWRGVKITTMAQLMSRVAV